jgi:ketosteroid isomerase-like protein
MKSVRRCILLIISAVVIAIFSGCGQNQEKGIPADLEAAIDAFYAAVEAGDAEPRIAMFTEEAIMMPNHWTIYNGKETIAAVIKSGEGSVFKIRDREIVDMDVSGSLAYTVNSYYYTYHAGTRPRTCTSGKETPGVNGNFMWTSGTATCP